MFQSEKMITLKLMVDNRSDRVIFAESNHDFVDTLLSFLTLPLGTVLRLVGSETASQIGSIGRVLAGAASMDEQHFTTTFVKSMVVLPRNAAESVCSKLKLNVNPSKAAKFYYCDCCSINRLSMLRALPCPCGSTLTVEMSTPEHEWKDERAFVNAGATAFMITDDLQILAGSTSSCIALLEKLGISDRNEVEERTVQIGLTEISHLLKSLFLSKSPLTDVLLHDHISLREDPELHSNLKKATDQKAVTATSNCMTLKLVVSKSKKRILYAKGGADVVDFLFSFLSFPLGMVVKLLNKSSKVRCMDNLYKSAEELCREDYIMSEECKKMLLSPKLAPHSIFKNHPLLGEDYPKYMISRFSGLIRLMADDNEESKVSLSESFEEIRHDLVVFLDPKTLAGETGSRNGYLKGPATFMISDNLKVVPFLASTVLTILSRFEVGLSDVEERVVTVGEKECLQLLKASLTSSTVLNDVFSWRDPFPKVMLKV